MSTDQEHRDGYGNVKFSFFGNLCNVGITNWNLYCYEEKNETDMIVTKNLHVRVAKTCVNWQKGNFRMENEKIIWKK